MWTSCPVRPLAVQKSHEVLWPVSNHKRSREALWPAVTVKHRSSNGWSCAAGLVEQPHLDQSCSHICTVCLHVSLTPSARLTLTSKHLETSPQTLCYIHVGVCSGGGSLLSCLNFLVGIKMPYSKSLGFRDLSLPTSFFFKCQPTQGTFVMVTSYHS